jgi:hypothetical protein
MTRSAEAFMFRKTTAQDLASDVWVIDRMGPKAKVNRTVGTEHHAFSLSMIFADLLCSIVQCEYLCGK